MSDIERELSEALTARADRAYICGGSVEGVRLLARRRTRRRGVAGAGVLVATSTLGIGALLARSPEPLRVTSAAGANPEVQPVTGADPTSDIWRCFRPAESPIAPNIEPSTTLDPSVSYTTTALSYPATEDGYYYMIGCEPVAGIGVPGTSTSVVLSDATSYTAVASSSSQPQEVFTTTTEVRALAPTTTALPGPTAVALPEELAECLILTGGSPLRLVLNSDCWAMLQQQPDTDRLVENIRSYVEGVGGYELYTIVAGDTLAGVANSFGVDLQRLADANGGSPDVVIFPGMPLLIPLNG
jgi:hypothetical protein